MELSFSIEDEEDEDEDEEEYDEEGVDAPDGTKKKRRRKKKRKRMTGRKSKGHLSDKPQDFQVRKISSLSLKYAYDGEVVFQVQSVLLRP